MSADGLAPGAYKIYLSLDYGVEEPVYEGEVQIAPGDDLDLGVVSLQKVIYHYSLEVALPVDLPAGEAFLTQTSEQRADGPSIKRKTRDEHGVFHAFTFEPISELAVGVDGKTQTFEVHEGMNVVNWSVD